VKNCYQTECDKFIYTLPKENKNFIYEANSCNANIIHLESNAIIAHLSHTTRTKN